MSFSIDDHDAAYPVIVETDRPPDGHHHYATFSEAKDELKRQIRGHIAHWQYVLKDVTSTRKRDVEFVD